MRISIHTTLVLQTRGRQRFAFRRGNATHHRQSESIAQTEMVCRTTTLGVQLHVAQPATQALPARALTFILAEQSALHSQLRFALWIPALLRIQSTKWQPHARCSQATGMWRGQQSHARRMVMITSRIYTKTTLETKLHAKMSATSISSAKALNGLVEMHGGSTNVPCYPVTTNGFPSVWLDGPKQLWVIGLNLQIGAIVW